MKSILNKSWAKGWVALALAFTAGCGGAKKMAEDPNRITVWHWMSDRQAAFEELSSRYEKTTGTKVVFELYAPSDAYAQKVRAAAQSKTLPDVYGILAETRDFASFIKSGHVENLTPAMEAANSEWKNFFYPKALATNTFQQGNAYEVTPGIYGVPIDVTSIMMLYNKGLLAKAGLDGNKPPQTWSEFAAAAEKLNAAKIPVFVSGWGELWMIDCFASMYAIHTMGEAKFLDTLRGKVAYTDPDWIKVLTLFEDMRKNRIPMEGSVTMINKTAEQNFANERAAFALNGSWCVNVYSGMNPNLDYAAMFPPKTGAKPMLVWGGAGSSFVVNANSNKKDKVADFLKWFTAKEQQAYLSETTKNLPANSQAATSLSPILASFAEAMTNTTHPSQWPLQEKPVVSEALTKGIQSILIGEKTAKQVAQDVQATKQQQMKGTN